MVMNGGNIQTGISLRSPWPQQPAQFLHSAVSASTRANPYILQPFYSMPLPASKPSASSTLPVLTSEPTQDTFSPSTTPSPTGAIPSSETTAGEIAPKPLPEPTQPSISSTPPNTSSPALNNFFSNTTSSAPIPPTPNTPEGKPVGSPAALNTPNQPGSPNALKAEQTASQVTEAVKPVLKSLFEEFEPARQEAEELIQNFNPTEISTQIRPKVELLQARVNEGFHKFPHPVRKTAERLMVHAFEDPKRQQTAQKLVNWAEQPPTAEAKAQLAAKHEEERYASEDEPKQSLIDRAGERLGHPVERLEEKFKDKFHYPSSHSSSSSLGKPHHKPLIDEDDDYISGLDEPPIRRHTHPSSSTGSHHPRPMPLDDDEF